MITSFFNTDQELLAAISNVVKVGRLNNSNEHLVQPVRQDRLVYVVSLCDLGNLKHYMVYPTAHCGQVRDGCWCVPGAQLEILDVKTINGLLVPQMQIFAGVKEILAE